MSRSVAFVLSRFRFLRRRRRRAVFVLSRLSGRGGGRGCGGLGGGGHELSLALAETALLPPFAFLLGLRGGLRASGQLAQERLNIALDRPRTAQEQFAQGRLATCRCRSSQLLGQRRVRRRRHSFLWFAFVLSSTPRSPIAFVLLSSWSALGANRAHVVRTRSSRSLAEVQISPARLGFWHTAVRGCHSTDAGS